MSSFLNQTYSFAYTTPFQELKKQTLLQHHEPIERSIDRPPGTGSRTRALLSTHWLEPIYPPAVLVFVGADYQLLCA